MNIDPMSERFCEVVPWDSLSDEEKKSGKWIELPSIGDQPTTAKRKTLFDLFAEDARAEQQRRYASSAVWTGSRR